MNETLSHRASQTRASRRVYFQIRNDRQEDPSLPLWGPFSSRQRATLFAPHDHNEIA